MGCPKETGKWILAILNLLLFVFGCIGQGLGVYIYFDEDGTLIEVNQKEIGTALMVTSGVIMFVAFLGCCGAKTVNKCLLGFYITLLVILLALVVGVWIFYIFTMDTLVDVSADEWEDDIIRKYGQAGEDPTTWRIDDIQRMYQCCGVRGGFRGNHSWLIWQSSQWYKKRGMHETNLVPESCCVKGIDDADLAKCQQKNTYRFAIPQPKSPQLKHITDANNQLNGNGCINVLEDRADAFLVKVGCVCGILAFILLFCVIMSCAICCACC